MHEEIMSKEQFKMRIKKNKAEKMNNPDHNTCTDQLCPRPCIAHTIPAGQAPQQKYDHHTKIAADDHRDEDAA